MSVQMELSRIVINENQDQQVIVLKEIGGDRQFSIIIGDPEAKAIERRLKGIPPKRPMTHELLATVIEKLGGTLEKIEIINLQDHTFYARLFVRQGQKMSEIDSRPSDAIALGIATTVPIFVAEHVLAAACQ
jgi:bifunctional DNase/RNase